MQYMNMIMEYFNHTWGYVELVGTVCSLVCVYLAIQQNIWTWFWGAVGVACFGPLFFHYQLYSDAGLQILFYLPAQALGWYWWSSKGANGVIGLPVSVLSTRTFTAILLAVVAVSGLNGWIMATYTDASFPYVDALTTWLSIAAQLLMIKKVVQSWVLWVTMDVIAIYVYFVKGLIVVSGLYVLFLALAILGGVAWYRASLKTNIQRVDGCEHKTV